MKLSPDNYKTCWDVHAWAGVIIGLFLAVMFATGAGVVFRAEIETWQDPYAQKPTPDVSYERLVEVVEDDFGAELPARFSLRMPDGEYGYPRMAYFSKKTGRYTEDWIDAEAGALADKPDKLATLLYHVHTLYDVRFSWLYYLAGVVSLVMLLVVTTGLAIQWHNLAEQFHQFRSEARPFVRWNDLHKVISVGSLPFQLFYAYSAVIIVLGPFFIDAVTGPVFEGDAQAARRASYGTLAGPAEPGEPAEPEALDDLVASAKHAVPGLEVDKLTLHNWGREGGRVDVTGGVAGERFSRARVRVDATSAAVVATSRPAEQWWAVEIRRWLIETHGVKFGGFGTRLLFALISMACAVSMVAGIGVWLARRMRRRDALVDRVLAKLTAGVATGTLVAAGAVFVASRLLPWEWGLDTRWRLEELTYFVTWLSCVGAAFAVTNVRRFWRVMLVVAGGLFLTVPVVAARLSEAGLFGLGDGESLTSVVGVDVGLVVVGATLVAAAYLLGNSKSTGREAS